MNCLDYMLDQWEAVGGYARFRKSSHCGVAHAQHVSSEGELSHYVPPADLAKNSDALWGFDGQIMTVDLLPSPPRKRWHIVGSGFLWAFGALIWAIKRTVADWVRPIP